MEKAIQVPTTKLKLWAQDAWNRHKRSIHPEEAQAAAETFSVIVELLWWRKNHFRHDIVVMLWLGFFIGQIPFWVLVVSIAVMK